jgi:hypothetical protein
MHKKAKKTNKAENIEEKINPELLEMLSKLNREEISNIQKYCNKVTDTSNAERKRTLQLKYLKPTAMECLFKISISGLEKLHALVHKLKKRIDVTLRGVSTGEEVKLDIFHKEALSIFNAISTGRSDKDKSKFKETNSTKDLGSFPRTKDVKVKQLSTQNANLVSDFINSFVGLEAEQLMKANYMFNPCRGFVFIPNSYIQELKRPLVGDELPWYLQIKKDNDWPTDTSVTYYTAEVILGKYYPSGAINDPSATGINARQRTGKFTLEYYEKVFPATKQGWIRLNVTYLHSENGLGMLN